MTQIPDAFLSDDFDPTTLGKLRKARGHLRYIHADPRRQDGTVLLGADLEEGFASPHVAEGYFRYETAERIREALGLSPMYLLGRQPTDRVVGLYFRGDLRYKRWKPELIGIAVA